MSKVSRLAVAAVTLLVLAGAAATVAKTVNRTPRFHHRALSAQQIRRVARTNRVIVVLKSQQRGRLATAASVRARATAQRAMRRPLIASVTRSGGAVTHQFTVLNAFAAQVSNAEKARLAASPAVASVLPDALVTESQPDAVGQTGSGQAAGAGQPDHAAVRHLPERPGKPLLEPEALQTMHVAYSDPSTPQAQNLATGKGVKVGVLRRRPGHQQPGLHPRRRLARLHRLPRLHRRRPERADRRRRGVRRRELDRRAGPPGLRRLELRQPGPPAAAGLQRSPSAAWRPAPR